MNFEQTYRQHFTELHRYAFTIVAESDWAKDIVQDAFVQYYQKLQSGIEIQHVRAYLYRSVHNTALTAIRKRNNDRKREKSIFQSTEEKGNIQSRIIGIESEEQEQAFVQKALNELPEQCRIVFVMSRLDGKKYREIADALGLSVKTVEAHIGKALKIIREFVRVNQHLLSLMSILLINGIFY